MFVWDREGKTEWDREWKKQRETESGNNRGGGNKVWGRVIGSQSNLCEVFWILLSSCECEWLAAGGAKCLIVVFFPFIIHPPLTAWWCHWCVGCCAICTSPISRCYFWSVAFTRRWRCSQWLVWVQLRCEVIPMPHVGNASKQGQNNNQHFTTTPHTVRSSSPSPSCFWLLLRKWTACLFLFLLWFVLLNHKHFSRVQFLANRRNTIFVTLLWRAVCEFEERTRWRGMEHSWESHNWRETVPAKSCSKTPCRIFLWAKSFQPF